MKVILLLLLFTTYCGAAKAQYRGNINDGFSSTLASVNISPNIYKGGFRDGFNSSLASVNISPNIYKGGINDGFNSVFSPVNSSPQIYRGGVNDGLGSSRTTANISPIIYTGGNGDGWSSIEKTINGETSVYIFTGTGNWDIPANWDKNLIPPSPLPAGYEIVIAPAAGSCLLNTIQVIAPAAKITVAGGKSFVIPGNLQ